MVPNQARSWEGKCCTKKMPKLNTQNSCIAKIRYYNWFPIFITWVQWKMGIEKESGPIDTKMYWIFFRFLVIVVPVVVKFAYKSTFNTNHILFLFLKKIKINPSSIIKLTSIYHIPVAFASCPLLPSFWTTVISAVAPSTSTCSDRYLLYISLL